MTARGRLIGALVLGPARAGETYAPDRCSAIASLASGVGTAFDALQQEAPPAVADRSRDDVLEAIRAVAADTARLSGVVASLSEAVAQRERRPPPVNRVFPWKGPLSK